GRNVKLVDSLIDYLLQKNGQKLFLEIKSALLHEGDLALYPDAPSLRGQKHIKRLLDLAQKGSRSALLFISSWPWVRAFAPNEGIDPEIALLLRQAHREGVIVRAINITLDSRNWAVLLLDQDLPVFF
ncbi:MAG: DNA/RNA nuclease SfsA, partial [bacterium]